MEYGRGKSCTTGIIETIRKALPMAAQNELEDEIIVVNNDTMPQSMN